MWSRLDDRRYPAATAEGGGVRSSITLTPRPSTRTLGVEPTDSRGPACLARR
jgi:hypothetical protein